MAVVNLSSISKKCETWSKTKNGATAMSGAVKKLVDSGSSRVTTKEEMYALGHTLRQFIINSAAGYNIPGSVLADIQSLEVSRPKDMGGGNFMVELSFAGDLHRESLYPEGYPDGVHNIVALYNNGMYAYKRAYKKTEAGTIVGARYREPLYFMSHAVEIFNDTYGGTYNVEAFLNDLYE